MLLLCLDGEGRELVSTFHQLDFPRHRRCAENVSHRRGSRRDRFFGGEGGYVLGASDDAIGFRSPVNAGHEFVVLQHVNPG